jgi:hypothetical protein
VYMNTQVFALTFIKGYRPLLFHLPFWTGVAFAVVMQLSTAPCCKDSMNVSGFKIGSGNYSTLLGFNVISAVVCWGLAGVALLDNRQGRKLEGQEDEERDGELEGGVAGKGVGIEPARSSSIGLLGLPVPAFLKRKGSDGGIAVDTVKDVNVGSGRARGEGGGEEGGKIPAVA